MELAPGETILITGGSGMVSQAATAIARWRGAEPVVAGRRRSAGTLTMTASPTSVHHN